MSLSRTSPLRVIQRSNSDRRQRDDDPPSSFERRSRDSDRREENNEEYVSFHVAGQLLGVAVSKVQEVLPPQTITRVPLSAKSIAGLLNLRGQIVTTLDLRERLLLPPREDQQNFMNIIINDGGELFSLIADDVGDVITAARRDFRSPPPTLDECWRICCEGVYRLQQGLLVIVDVPSLIDLSNDTQDLMKEVL